CSRSRRECAPARAAARDGPGTLSPRSSAELTRSGARARLLASGPGPIERGPDRKVGRAMPSLDAQTRARARRAARTSVAVLAITAMLGFAGASSANPSGTGLPDFGPNVLVFDPSMSTSQIQAAVDAVAAQQVDNEMGTQRYA